MAGAALRGAAVVATTGSLAWVVKGGTILAGRPQPPLLLDLGLACFALALLLLALRARSRLATGLGVVATGAGSYAAVAELLGLGVGPTTALAAVALVVGLVVLRPRDQPGGWIPRGIGLAAVPATAAGGLLALGHETLLEVSTVGLALAWGWLGLRLWRASALPDGD